MSKTVRKNDLGNDVVSKDNKDDLAKEFEKHFQESKGVNIAEAKKEYRERVRQLIDLLNKFMDKEDFHIMFLIPILAEIQNKVTSQIAKDFSTRNKYTMGVEFLKEAISANAEYVKKLTLILAFFEGHRK